MEKLLDTIHSPRDLKNLDVGDLKRLTEEIREFIVSVVSKTGGHLAPNLGVVELTLALHTVFDAPKDKIVWDVGHQSYIHKILTGRKDQFHTLRQYGGISGFPKMAESEYDAFGAGHASTAISAALGMATARDLQGKNHKVIAVVGDGALTGGLAFEGLNNAGGSKRNFIVILNDNNMSISPNVGAMAKHLTQVITTPLYNKIKKDIWQLTGKLPRGSKMVRDTVRRIEEGLKSMVVPGLLFERLGFRYFGPVDGHNLIQLLRVLKSIQKIQGPVLVHVISKKGKGYKFAEENATKFHGLGSFCRETGDTESKTRPTYTEIFGKTMVELAEKDERIVGITAAMADGTGLIHFAERFPERFFDVGIAEQHAVTFAAGLALDGFKPVVAIYSTFLQRALDQLIHDVALQKIPLVFALDRGGLVGEDGPTHHGSFDLSYLRLIPDLVVMAPKDEVELRDMFWTALQYQNGPVAIRYPRGECLGLRLKKDFDNIPIGKSEIIKKGHDMAILAIGDRVMPAVELSQKLEAEGISAQVVNARFVKPIDREMVKEMIQNFRFIVTVENNSIIGGFGSGIAEMISESDGKGIVFRRFGLPDRFVPHGNMHDLLVDVKLDLDHLSQAIQSFLAHGHKMKKSISYQSIS
ncbi:1-deoxy-D-xylulose-5-phosphate synthase [bacterium]|nr:1-deoxy-D-xylulose-5-phosphate synthase [bacterium]RQV96354.1 MAG: 1-deoxy-D-xylulose-5-phosphate synthase [bacterium]